MAKSAAAFFLTLAVAVTASADRSFDQAVGRYFQDHCIACHGEDQQEGDFRIDTLSKQVGLQDTALWAEVRERISSGEMPPQEVENPPTAEQGRKWFSG